MATDQGVLYGEPLTAGKFSDLLRSSHIEGLNSHNPVAITIDEVEGTIKRIVMQGLRHIIIQVEKHPWGHNYLKPRDVDDVYTVDRLIATLGLPDRTNTRILWQIVPDGKPQVIDLDNVKIDHYYHPNHEHVDWTFVTYK